MTLTGFCYLVMIVPNDHTGHPSPRFLRVKGGFSNLTHTQQDAFRFGGKQEAIAEARKLNIQLPDYTARVVHATIDAEQRIDEFSGTVWPIIPGKR